MRIWYQDQWLVTGTDVDDIAPLFPIGLGGEQAVEVAEYLRAPAVQLFARGNRQQTLSLKTTQLCESYEEAFRLAAMAQQLTATQGELRIELDDGSTLTAEGAALKSVQPTRVGSSLDLAYEFSLATWVVDLSGVTVVGAFWDGRDYSHLPFAVREGGYYGDLNLITPSVADGGSY